MDTEHVTVQVRQAVAVAQAGAPPDVTLGAMVEQSGAVRLTVLRAGCGATTYVFPEVLTVAGVLETALQGLLRRASTGSLRPCGPNGELPL
ncbi:hypothetical protein LAJ19_19235 (plasmid) [Deinococcus taeanensis]|uniref:hypothetical protein n=1 Tax=Deinococcus taeanensis TaxID=2737050 RepID=UPI001CDBBF0F|nr:hypothetical protein [Deinococcus taeanensis]UBV44923.1 hypothetical protein LAJ19_19235 [Deinococcus taeanensis]